MFRTAEATDLTEVPVAVAHIMSLLKSFSPYVLLGLSETLMHDRMLSLAVITAGLLRILGLFRDVQCRLKTDRLRYAQNQHKGTESCIMITCLNKFSSIGQNRQNDGL